MSLVAHRAASLPARGLGATWAQDAFCFTSPNCAEGKGKVAQLRALLDEALRQGLVKREVWEPQVSVLEDAVEKASRLRAYLGGGCCEAKRVGEQADLYAVRLARAAGMQLAPRVGTAGGTEGDRGGLLRFALGASALGLLAWFAARGVRSTAWG